MPEGERGHMCAKMRPDGLQAREVGSQFSPDLACVYMCVFVCACTCEHVQYNNVNSRRTNNVSLIFIFNFTVIQFF